MYVYKVCYNKVKENDKHIKWIILIIKNILLTANIFFYYILHKKE